MGIPERLVQIREENGYTRKRLAEELGKPYATITKYETGQREPGHSYIIEIAKKFGVSTDYILGVEKESPSPEKSELGEDQELSKEDEELYLSLRAVLEKAKIVAPGEPLSPDQAQRVIAILQLIRLLFDKGTEEQ